MIIGLPKAMLGRSIRLKLTLFVAVLIVVIGMILSWSGFLFARYILYNQINERLSVIAFDRKILLLSYIHRQQELISQVAIRTRLRIITEDVQTGKMTKAAFQKEINQILKHVLAGTSSFSEGLILNPQGKIIAASNAALINQDFSTHPDFLPSLKEKHFGLPHLVHGKYLSYLAAPIPSVRNESRIIGVAMILLDVTPTLQSVGNQTGLGKTGEVVVGKKQGDKISYFYPYKVAINFPFPLEPNAPGFPMASAINGKTGFKRTYDYLGARVLAAYSPVGYKDWGLVVKIEEMEAHTPVIWLSRILLALNIGILLLSILASYLLARQVTNPILKLTSSTKAVAAGNLDTRICIKTNDEIGALGKAFNDMTEALERGREHLKESEERFRTLADNIPNMSWMTNADGWVFWYNKRWYEYTGTTLEQMEGWGWQLAHDSNELPKVLERWKVSLASGEPFEMVFPLKGADGIFRPFLTRIVPVHDEQGRIVRWFGTNTDITEQKKIREELEASNSLLNLISRIQTQFISGGNLWNLFDSVVQDTLSLTDSKFGYIGEVLYKESGAPYLVFRGLTNIAWSPEIQKLYEQMKNVDLEFHNIKNLFGADIKDGGSVVISNDPAHDPKRGGFLLGPPLAATFMGLPIYAEGKMVGQLAIANRTSGYTEELAKFLEPLVTTCGNIIQAYRNNEYRKKAEKELRELAEELEQRVNERTAQLQAANKELEAFSYSVSHDLRAPLRGIDGFSQALLDQYKDQLDDTGKHYLNQVRQGSQQMAKLIDDMLQLSRLTRGEMKLEPINLSATAKSIAQEFLEHEPDRQVEFVIKDGITVHGDKRLLQAVMQNLLNNAWKYTSKHPTARIEFGETEQDNMPVYFIKDDGAGFDMKYAGKLFGAFQRLHGTTEFPGTGVGLATVARIIQRHGGKIWAQAEVEKGAAFYFTLGRSYAA